MTERTRRGVARRAMLAGLSASIAGCVRLGDRSSDSSGSEEVPSPGPRPDHTITAEEFVLGFSVEEDQEWIGPYYPPQEANDPDPPLAMMRIIVETPEGKRVGIDPETGEVVQEVEAASVQGAGRERTVLIQGHPELDVTISGAALLETIRAHGYDPETVPYHLRVIVDTEPYIEEREDQPPEYHGRAIHSVDRTTDTEGSVFPHATVELAPWSIAADPAAEPLWAHVTLEEPFEPGRIDVEGVRFNDVAVTPASTAEPVVLEGGAGGTIAFPFPREEIVGLLDPGRHEISVSGTVGDAVFVGMAPFDIEA